MFTSYITQIPHPVEIAPQQMLMSVFWPAHDFVEVGELVGVGGEGAEDTPEE